MHNKDNSMREFIYDLIGYLALSILLLFIFLIKSLKFILKLIINDWKYLINYFLFSFLIIFIDKNKITATIDMNLHF